MRVIILLLFILTIGPLAAVIIHDGYLGWQDYQKGSPIGLSDVGWIWTEYHETSYQAFNKAIDPINWDAFIIPILEQKALWVTVFNAIVYTFLIILLKVLGIGHYAEAGKSTQKSSGKFAFSKKDLKKPKGQFKYTRK